jgi:4-hydroxybenzoate polyprenyltransferase
VEKFIRKQDAKNKKFLQKIIQGFILKTLPTIKLIRFKKPIGSFLLFLPCLFGLVLANHYQNNLSWQTNLWFVFLFFIGSFLMRSAGCIINDIADRDFDKKVARTNNRPIASGQISIKKALFICFLFLLLSLLILLQFNLPTILLGFLALFLVVLYPFTKRFTYYPQLFLGMTFNFGILIGFCAVLGKINLPVFILYLSAIIWVFIYDTIYGYQDIEDDLKIGVKSTSIKFKENPRQILSYFALLHLFLLILVGISAGLNFSYYPTILLASSALVCGIRTCDFNDGNDCLKKFKANIWVGVLILLALIFGVA